jgi:hypothetical protein
LTQSAVSRFDLRARASVSFSAYHRISALSGVPHPASTSCTRLVKSSGTRTFWQRGPSRNPTVWIRIREKGHTLHNAAVTRQRSIITRKRSEAEGGKRRAAQPPCVLERGRGLDPLRQPLSCKTARLIGVESPSTDRVSRSTSDCRRAATILGRNEPSTGSIARLKAGQATLLSYFACVSRTKRSSCTQKAAITLK